MSPRKTFYPCRSCGRAFRERERERDTGRKSARVFVSLAIRIRPYTPPRIENSGLAPCRHPTINYGRVEDAKSAIINSVWDRGTGRTGNNSSFFSAAYRPRPPIVSHVFTSCKYPPSPFVCLSPPHSFSLSDVTRIHRCNILARSASPNVATSSAFFRGTKFGGPA